MSTPTEIINQLKTQLSADSTLSAYVKNFFIGQREGITQVPVLFIEPLETIEEEAGETYPYQDISFRVAVIGFIRGNDLEKQVAGDSTEPGVLNVENDVKKAVMADRTIGGYAIKTIIRNTTFGVIEYPVRGFAMEIEILFRQQSVTRT